jgi:hypothetical protein
MIYSSRVRTLAYREMKVLETVKTEEVPNWR